MDDSIAAIYTVDARRTVRWRRPQPGELLVVVRKGGGLGTPENEFSNFQSLFMDSCTLQGLEIPRELANDQISGDEVEGRP